MFKFIVVLILFVLIAGAMTYPLYRCFDTHIAGTSISPESCGTLWNFWRIRHDAGEKESLRTTRLIAHPFGLDMNPRGFIQYIGSAFGIVLALALPPAAVWNTQIIINFCLSALIVFLLVSHISGSRLAGFFSGCAFAFSPSNFARGWQHLGPTHTEWVPLVLFAAFLARSAFTREVIGWYVLSVILLFSFDYSIAYIGMTALGLFFVYVLLFEWRVKLSTGRGRMFSDLTYIRRSIVICAIAGVLLTPQILILLKTLRAVPSTSAGSVYNPGDRPYADLCAYSARPLSFFLPAPVHPVFGGFTRQFSRTALYGTHTAEHTLYLGWTTIILAVVAARRWLRRETGPRDNATGESPRFYIGFFIFLASGAWFLSQPPAWNFGSLRIPMPSFFIYKILPMYRVYARFGILVMLACAALAGFGLKFILDGIRRRSHRSLTACAVCGMLLFEFWNWPPYRVIDVSTAPGVYYWMRDQKGDFAIAEYPLDAQAPNEMYKFYQITHGKKIINGSTPGAQSRDLAHEIIKLSDPRTAGILRWMGVRYALVHRDAYESTGRSEDKDELGRIPKNPGFAFVRSFPAQTCPPGAAACVSSGGRIDVYVVTASPVDILAEKQGEEIR